MRQVCVVVTARPSYSRIKTALEAIKDHPDLNLQVVLAGSACAMIDQVRQDGFCPHVVPCLRGKYTHIAMAKTVGTAIDELAAKFENMEPDIVVTIADRYETLATAIAASYLNIPLAHVQGGEHTGSIDDKVRRAITELADFHFVATNKADRVIRRGRWFPDIKGRIFNVGCPSIDLCARVGLDPGVWGTYAMIMLHPVTDEPEDTAYEGLVQIVRAMENLKMKAYMAPFNIDAGGAGIRNAVYELIGDDHPLIQVLTPKKPEEFLELVGDSAVLIGNSSMGIRECSWLGVPAINIGRRQQGRECAANVLHLPTRAPASVIEGAIRCQQEIGRFPKSELYGDGTAGKQIAECLSYVSLG